MFPINNWMIPHIEILNNIGNVYVVTSNPEFKTDPKFPKLVYKSVKIKIPRKISIFKDIISLLKLIIFFRKMKFDLLIVTMPKSSFVGMIAGYICKIPKRIYISQGEVWSGNFDFKSIKWFN